MLAFGGGGCTSIYNRAQSRLPPEPKAALAMRVAEAAKAEKLAGVEGARLLNSIERRSAVSVLETDLDRLEAVAFDFERRVRTAWDASEGCGGPAEAREDIERMSVVARRWLDFVQTARQTNPEAWGQPLRELTR
jgi:hypothetical protein